MMSLLLRRHSLVARLLWFTLAAMTTVTVLIAVLVNTMVSHSRMEQSVSQQQLINREIAQHIATAFEQRIDHLQRLAGLLVDGDRLLPQSRLQTLLDNRIGLHDAFNAGMILIGPDGHIQLDSPIIENRVGTDLSDRDHFLQTRDLRQPVVSRPLVGRAIKQPLYITSVPVQTADGRFLGSLAGINRLEADNTLKLMAARRLPQGGQLYVIDLDTELVVTSTRRSLIMAGLDSLANSEIIAQVRAGQRSGVARSHFGHQAVYSAGTLERTGWLILTTAPVDYWMAPLHELLVQISLLALVCLLLLGAVALVYLRYQLMPLKHAAEGVNRMRRDLSQLTPLPVYRNDEVGQCVEAFNGLLLQLQNRTAQLANSRDEAEEASRVKTEFLANMSHELRTPLVGVIGLAEIQLSRVEHAEDRARLNKILQSSRLLLAHLDAILTYVAAESGQLSLQCSAVMLDDQLQALQMLHQPAADEKELNLVIKGPELSQACQLDQQALMQVLNSLMTNAIKFTERGEVRLDVQLQQSGDKARLCFSMSDTGKGIPELLQQKLFHTFQQIESGHSRTFNGIGVGLVLSQRLVLLMGGEWYTGGVETGRRLHLPFQPAGGAAGRQ
ncbi:sensor histidine kinase [Marinobacterium weihaiense]|uniref:histidine kinase n=1 Tax=Marinobacterium weihaiense TaxID=2851016 RepID=A0ABS6MCP1_9GAMM|nr:ATP-binding protein [Marinobacterium weihaiense]MBV0933611.1 hypothetical protein [Marinobacterium weihaiense]